MPPHPARATLALRRRSVALTATVLSVLLMSSLVTAAPVAGQVAPPPPPPVITSVGPAIIGPGDDIKISGRSFVEVRAVSMAGLSLKFKVRTRRTITAKGPASAARGTIVVTTRGGTATSPRAIVVVPQIEIDPPEGPAGSTIDVSGRGFMPGEPIDLSHGRAALEIGTADGRGRLPVTQLLIPSNAAPGPSVVRAQGRFSGVPVDAVHLVISQWPQRGLRADGNRRTRSDAYLGVTASPSLTLDWIADTIGPVRSSPAVVDDTLYVGADTGAVLSVSTACATDGRSCDPQVLGITRGAVSSSPAVLDSIVYAGSEDGSFYAFDAACSLESGPCPPLWRWETGGPITSSPAVAEDTVVVGSADGSIYAFDVPCDSDDGACRPRWTAATGGPVRSSPAIQDGVVYVGSDDGYLHAYAADCGMEGAACEPLWRGWTGGVVRSSPAVVNGLVYVGSADAKVHGFPVDCADDGRVCQAVWRGDADAAITSSPVVADSFVVAGTEAGSVMAFPVACADQAVGCKPSWTAITGGAVRSSPAVNGAAPGGSMVFVGSDDGFLYGFPLVCRPSGSPATCQAVWASGTSAPISASPAVVDGSVYVSSEDGTIRRWSLR